MASYVGNVQAGGNSHLVASTLYGTCDSIASAQTKNVRIDNCDAVLLGMTIHVKFTNPNTWAADSEHPLLLKLNNVADSYPIYTYGANCPGNTAFTSWKPDSVVSFTLTGDGASRAWYMNDIGNNTPQGRSDLINLFYPVGSIYMTENGSFNPNTQFGGTWTRIQDRFLLAAGSTYTTANQEGGSATVALETGNLPAHTHQVGAHNHGLSSIKTWINAHVHGYQAPPSDTNGTAISTAQMPSHSHEAVSLTGHVSNFGQQSQNTSISTSGVFSPRYNGREYVSWGTAGEYKDSDGFNFNASHAHPAAGGGQAHSHSITSVATNTAASTAWSGDSTDNSTAFDSGSTGSGTAHDNMPPYRVVYVWRRDQ